MAKADLISEIRELQAQAGDRVLATSTLSKRSIAALTDMLADLRVQATVADNDDVGVDVGVEDSDGDGYPEVYGRVELRPGLWGRIVAFVARLFRR